LYPLTNISPTVPFPTLVTTIVFSEFLII
jgi:hypothetical protein